MKIFFDTSAYVKRFVDEIGSEQVDSVIEEAAELGLSIICYPEIISALNSKRRLNLLSDKDYDNLKVEILQDIEDIDIINITPEILQKVNNLLEENTLRTLDAIYIASALEWQADLLVSADKRQTSAAMKSGLKVLFVKGIEAEK